MANFLSLIFNFHIGCFIFIFCHLCKFFSSYFFFIETMSENYNLNWHSFSEHLQVMFKDLYQEGKYTDVTLVSDDQTQFKAHKIVLSASSPVIKKFLMNFPSNNVIKTRIYHCNDNDLRGIVHMNLLN